mgnify:CR=1 FL=1
MTFVLDACAIIALLRNEAGAEITDRLLLEQTCMAHAVNLCEVYYDLSFAYFIAQKIKLS